jgi:hypothetical protein
VSGAASAHARVWRCVWQAGSQGAQGREGGRGRRSGGPVSRVWARAAGGTLASSACSSVCGLRCACTTAGRCSQPSLLPAVRVCVPRAAGAPRCTSPRTRCCQLFRWQSRPASWSTPATTPPQVRAGACVCVRLCVCVSGVATSSSRQTLTPPRSQRLHTSPTTHAPPPPHTHTPRTRPTQSRACTTATC